MTCLRERDSALSENGGENRENRRPEGTEVRQEWSSKCADDDDDDDWDRFLLLKVENISAQGEMNLFRAGTETGVCFFSKWMFELFQLFEGEIGYSGVKIGYWIVMIRCFSVVKLAWILWFDVLRIIIRVLKLIRIFKY